MNLPTKITLIRIFMIPLVLVSYCLQGLWNYMFLVTAGLFFVASMTDSIDGYIARKQNLVTDLGKFLDPIADKLLVVVGLLIVIHGNYIVNPYVDIYLPNMTLICSIIILAREFIIGLFRQIAAKKGIVMAADKLGKIKTIATMSAIDAFLFSLFKNAVAARVFYFLGFVIIIIATCLTVVSGVNYIVKNKQVLFGEKKD